MKIVVTGALGHIGSKVIREMPKAFPNSQIVMIDNLTTQRYCSLFDLPRHGNYQFIEADVLETELKPLIAAANVVIHLAAITDAASSFQNREKVEFNNFNSTSTVAQACADAGVPLIHLSSTSVYGTQNDVVDEDCGPDELKPQSPYAETKLKEEVFLKSMGEKEDLNYITCRFGTICGVSAGMRFHTAVNKFCWQAVMGQPLTVWKSSLHQRRPYLTLSDAIEALKYIIKSELFDRRIYNVLTENLSVNCIVEGIKRHIPQLTIDYVDSEIMNQLSYNVRNQRFIETGFKFTGSVEKSIDETIRLLKTD